ncbi:Nuclear transport factor 2 (NTF2) domain [Musa troglodytarum]|uniref:Nuclear transport factor 2 (NTF2) domain n=1 Tax=Musa troglodytarum TaxID=320322 RepID=A0A9E7ETA9_9LILI|nr:Nuclear transport factor 2 (NTF2) domain [Musa troglodytarum]
MTSFYPGHVNATQILQQQPDSVHQFYTNLSSMVRSDGAATESVQGMLEEHAHQLPESVLVHGDFETKQDATNSLPEPVSGYTVAEQKAENFVPLVDAEENDSGDNNTIDEVPQEFPVCDEREDETPPEEPNMTHPNAINNSRDLSPTPAEEPVAEPGRPTYASIANLFYLSSKLRDNLHKLDLTLREERSVYVGNLPSSISTSNLEQEFKNFGRLKPDGVSIRSRKEAGVFYAFIEYEDATGVQNALKEGAEEEVDISLKLHGDVLVVEVSVGLWHKKSVIRIITVA